MYASWANNITKQLPAPGTRSGKLPQAFSMDTYDNFDQLTAEKLQINVTGGGAGERTESLIDLTGMIVEERKIDRVVARGQRYHEQGKLAKNEFDVLIDRIRNETQIAQRRETQALSNIRSLTGITSNRDFYDRFIAGNDDIDTVKELFITQFAKDPALEGADLDELFKEATYKMAHGALKEIGGQRSTRIMGSSEAKSLINQLQGDDVGLVTEYTNALGMIEALNDPDIVKNLGKIGIDKKHTDHLSNIMEYVASKQAVAIAGDASARGMNPNEVLSRAYNIAREMVSPQYIASELAIRIIQKNNSDTFLLALQSKEAAQIMEKMMYFPEKIRPQDMKTFEALLVQFAAVETIKRGQEQVIEAWYGETLGEETDEN